MRQPRLRLLLVVSLTLVVVAAGPAVGKERATRAEKAANCSLEGTWYGYNTEGDAVLTIQRTGKDRYSVIFDVGAMPRVPPATATTDWRGEIKKIGGKKYQYTSMAYLPLDESLGVPLAMGLCTATTKQTGCDVFRSRGSCTFLGFFHRQNPLVEGFPLVEEPLRLRNRFWRMRVSTE